MKTDSQCRHCRHLIEPGPSHGITCAAFPAPYPDSIPDEIYENRHDHREPYPGDGGIRWEPASEAEADFWLKATRTEGRGGGPSGT